MARKLFAETVARKCAQRSYQYMVRSTYDLFEPPKKRRKKKKEPWEL